MMSAVADAARNMHFAADHAIPFSFQQTYPFIIPMRNSHVAGPGIWIHDGHRVSQHVIFSQRRPAIRPQADFRLLSVDQAPRQIQIFPATGRLI